MIADGRGRAVEAAIRVPAPHVADQTAGLTRASLTAVS